MLLVHTDLKTALGAVVPDQADIRGVNTCANKHVKVLMNDVLELKCTKHSMAPFMYSTLCINLKIHSGCAEVAFNAAAFKLGLLDANVQIVSLV